METNKESIHLLSKVNPNDSFWNLNQQSKKTNNSNKWGFQEKRFSTTQLFNSNRRRNDPTDTVNLGPGAGAGVGCGVGLGLGLVGGVGFSSGPWNSLRLVFGFGLGCGVGAGFGYGQGLGYGLDWKSIQSQVFGFKDKDDSRKRAILHY